VNKDGIVGVFLDEFFRLRSCVQIGKNDVGTGFEKEASEFEIDA
jgi:hypothetical protein